MMTIRAHICVESTLGRVTQVLETLATLPGVKKAMPSPASPG